jgi:predicted metal-dependent peptidase
MDTLVQRAKVQLMLFRPFYGSLIARLQLRDTNLKTFATDGQFLYVPKEYPFDKDELVFVMAHEVMHCALLHMFRRGNRDPFIWNCACDYAVNSLLRNDRFKIPKDILYDAKYIGKPAEYIYDELMKNAIKISLPMADLLEKGGQENKEDNKDGNSQQNQGKSAEEIQQGWKEALASAVELGKGDLPSEFREIINSFLFPKVPWQQTLFRYLQIAKGQQDFRTYPFNRAHIWRKCYLPSLAGEFIEISIGLDTSGSQSQQELSKALSETRGICGSFGDYLIHLMFCDAGMHDTFEITSDSEIPDFVTGRGGTDFRPVFDKIYEEEWEHLPLVFFTDLMGTFPSKPKDNTFWVITERSKGMKVPFGEVILM